MNTVELAEVILWERRVGAVAWNRTRGVGSFQYEPDFLESGIELAPLMMPLANRVYNFPEISRETFKGLPGLLADTLPDKFGNLLIDQWLANQGRRPADFSPIERLCYVGERGMGALEFRPSIKIRPDKALPIEVNELVKLANAALNQKASLDIHLTGQATEDADAMRDIIRVGTSAGGARAKAVVAWNEQTGSMRSGQVKAPEGYSYWLLKFDGVSGNKDKELADPLGFGKVEYAYYLMARAAGIEISDSRLLEENGRSHFMTKRFDRGENGEKRFMQSLCGLAHYDFNLAGAYSYEQALLVMARLGLPKAQQLQLFKRAIFNIFARNQDDHTKNIAFMMNKRGQWKLAPAYDLTYSYNPDGLWTNSHQMTFNGKRDDFAYDDLMEVGRRFHFQRKVIKETIAEVADAVAQWPDFAEIAGVEGPWIGQIAKAQRLHLAQK